MRRYMKQQMLEVVETLIEAIVYIQNNLQKNNSYLIEDSLLALADVFVALEEERSPLPVNDEHMKFTLINNLYTDYYNDLNKLLIFIKNLKVKKEIVFLPYKADMWDSLHSVWAAASQDTEVNVSVVPIPYYNMRNGERYQKIYEGELFPKEIQVIHYEDYDITLEKPDVIFIHNPYDHLNYVTQIDDQYFSSELIKYTDKLVYIPYHVVLGTPQEALFKQYGVYNSWRTFVQSDEVKKRYLEWDVLKEEQIISMGSPKIDYIQQKLEAKEEMPVVWEAKLKNKTTFFVNSSIASFLNDTELALKRLEYVLDLLTEGENYGVIWRPHPLLEDTLHSLREEHVEHYHAIVEKAKCKENLIMDYSNEAYRAIKYSDAYVGDYSSIVPLYGVSGKPIYLIGKDMIDEMDVEGEAHISFFDFEKTGIDMIIPAINHNAIYRVNLEGKQIEILAHDQRYAFEEHWLYYGIVQKDDICWFIPCRAENIMTLDLKTGETEFYTLPRDFEVNGYIKFREYVVENQNIWLIPGDGNMVIKVNMETKAVCGYNNWPVGFEKKQVGPMFLDGQIVGNWLYLLPGQGSNMLKMHLKTGEFTICQNSISANQYVKFCYEKEEWTMIPLYGKKILIWDEASNTEKYIEIDLANVTNEVPFYSALVENQRIWLSPRNATEILAFNLSESRVEHTYDIMHTMDKDRCESLKSWSRYGKVKEIGSHIYFTPVQASKLVCYDLETNRFEENNISISKREIKNYRQIHHYASNIEKLRLETINHSDVDSLESFKYHVKLENLEKKQERQKCIVKAIGTDTVESGNEIWSYVSKALK